MMEIEITVGILYAKSSLRMDRSDHSVPDAPIVGPAFTGEWRTGGTGMQYHRARHLSPGLGVWLSLDPFEGISSRPMSLNGYSWVEGQFPSTTDPSGRETRLQCYQTCVDNPCHYNENDPLYWVDEVFPRPDPYYIADGYCPEIGHQPWQGEFQRCVMRCDYFHTNRFDAYKQAPTFGDVAGGLLMALARELGGGSCGDRLMLGLVGAARNPGLIAGRAVSTANPYITTAAILGILAGAVILTLTAGTTRKTSRIEPCDQQPFNHAVKCSLLRDYQHTTFAAAMRGIAELHNTSIAILVAYSQTDGRIPTEKVLSGNVTGDVAQRGPCNFIDYPLFAGSHWNVWANQSAFDRRQSPQNVQPIKAIGKCRCCDDSSGTAFLRERFRVINR